MASPRKGSGPPPPVPRQHPSRPTLRASFSGASVDATSPSSSSVSPVRPTAKPPSPSKETRSSRPNSSLLLGGAGPESPSMRLATGFASVRVGIGSPKLNFRSGGNRREGSGGSSSNSGSPKTEDDGRFQDAVSVPESTIHEESRRVNGVIDRVSGLPSPPGTESDIALPSYSGKAQGIAKDPAPSRLSNRLPLSPRPELHRTSSLASSTSTQRRFRPKASPALSRSSSSSSAALLTSPAQSRDARITTNGSRASASPSPVKAGHHRSPSAPTSQERKNRRTSKRMSGSWENVLADEAIREERSAGAEKGIDLDERIREAEEKIKRADARRARASLDMASTSGSPGRALRRHESYSRANGSAKASPVVASSTLRRSATLSSASAWSVGGEVETPDRREGTMRRQVATPADDDRERSGGSSGSGKRKPLPTEFRQGSLFSPSRPDARTSDAAQPSQPVASRSGSVRQSIDSPVSAADISPLQSGLALSSRLPREIDQVTSPSATRHYETSRIESLERLSSISRQGDPSPYARRQWSESISGLPRPQEREGVDHRGLPLPRQRLQYDRQRAESVLDTATDRHRYQSRAVNDIPMSSRSSRLNIMPADSVSAVGARSERSDPTTSTRKDPLDVIRRLEAQRAQHNRQWQEDRAASVLGDVQHSPTRPYSGLDRTPLYPRAATSMSNLREGYRAPNTAPIDRFSASKRWDNLPPSPSARSIAHASHFAPATEPRTMRSNTSLGVRSNTSLSLDTSSASTEHGRLLFEAFRALELKLPPDLLNSLPDLIRSFHSSTRSVEGTNTSLRSALLLATDISVRADLDDPSLSQQGLNRLSMILREATRTSDQSIRDLTRIMLDLPKILREGSRINPVGPSSSTSSTRGLRRSESVASGAFDQIKRSPEVSRRWVPPSPDDFVSHSSPLAGRQGRHSVDVLRPATSLADISTHRERDRGITSSSSSFISRVRGLALTPRKNEAMLHTIEASPPTKTVPRVPSRSITGKSQRNSPLGSLTTAFPTLEGMHNDRPPPPLKMPKSPERPRNVLKKKASSASTNTVKGSAPFFPSSPRVRTTTAVSNVTAGNDNTGLREEGSPTGTGSRSIRSWRSSVEVEDAGMGSPVSRYSVKWGGGQGDKSGSGTRVGDGEESGHERGVEGYSNEDTKERRRFGNADSFELGQLSEPGLEDGNGLDAVARLEQRLALAAAERDRQREGREGREEREGRAYEADKGLGSKFSARVKAGWRRG